MKLLKLLVFLVSLFPLIARGQGTKFSRQAIEGLESTPIKSITKDPFGFMWIATRDGLVRYNGYDTHWFSASAKDSNSLPDNAVNCIKVLKNGKLIVGMQFSGIALFDFATEHFENLKADRKPGNLSNNQIMDIFEDSKNRIWIGTWDGLELFDPSRKIFTPIKVPDDHAMFTGKNFVSQITEDRSGRIWVYCQGNRIASVEQNKYGYSLVIRKQLETIDGITSTGSVLVDSDNTLWVGGYSGTFRYSIVGDDLLEIPGPYKNIQKTYVRDVLEDASGSVWLATDGNGLFEYNIKTKKFTSYRNSSTDPLTLSTNAISTLYESAPGLLWIGTYSGGINTRFLRTPDFQTFTDVGKAGSVLPNKSVLSFCENEDKILVGTDGGSIATYDVSSQSIKAWEKSAALPSKVIKCMLKDSEGKIWMGSFKGGLSVFDPRTNQIKNFLPVEKTNPTSVHHNNIWCLTEDKAGNIWIGLLGEGIDVFNKKTNAFKHYPLQKDFKNGLRDSYIHALFTDHQGNVWVGSERGGLYRYDPAQDKFIVFQNNPNDTTSISGNNIKSIFQDVRGTIWVGTEHNGFNKILDLKKGIFKRFQKHFPPSVFGITGSSNGDLWLSSNMGIVRFNTTTEQYSYYDAADGLQGTIFATGACFTDHNGNQYWGGPNGFTTLYSREQSIPEKEDSVYISELRLFNEVVSVGNSKLKKIEKPVYMLKNIVFEYSENVISFSFSTLEYRNPGKKKFQYKLEGFDQEWTTTDAKQRMATYTNLSPGNYVFCVRVSNDQGGWGKIQAKLNIEVLPPWYMTWWFRIATSLLIIFAVAGIFYWRVKEIEKRNKELHQEVTLRTSDLREANQQLKVVNTQVLDQNKLLEEINEEIRKQNSTILEQQQEIVQQKEELEKANHTKDKLFSVVSHDLRNPANALKSLSELLSRADLTTTKEREEIIQRIHGSSKALSHLVNNILDWARTQISGMKASLQESSLNEIVQEALAQIRTQAESKRIELRVLQDGEFLMYADRAMMTSAIRNIVSNAVKFTPQFGRIEISLVELPEQGIMISVQDNGIGMNDAQKSLLFDLQKNAYTLGTNNEIGSGIGMSITHEFVRLHNGSIEVFSNPGEGTKISILLHYKEKRELIHIPVQEQPIEILKLEEEYQSVRGKKLLIVEDDQTTRELLKRTFADTFEIYEAQDGNTAYFQTLTHQPEIIISDIRMPNTDGYELCQKLKSDPQTSHTAIFLITSEDSKESQLKAFQSGADDYFPKPLSKEILLAKISSYFENLEKRIRQFTGEDVIESDGLTTNKVDKELLEKIICYIEEHLSDANLNADVICREVSVSRAVLYRKLKSITGQSVNEFIRIIRLKKSIELLRTGELNISQVAYEVGFNSLSYYTRSFTKQFGKNPSDFIRNG